jgi:uncharacterized protein (TIGR02246 family)
MSATHRAPQTPEDVDRLFGEYMNAGDTDGLASLYEANGTLVDLDRKPLTGRPAIRAYFAALGAAAKMAITMNVTKVVRGGDDVAVLYNDWTAVMTAPDGKRTDLSGKALEIVRRQTDGSWRFVIDDPNARG